MVASRRAKAANETANAANITAANQVKATKNQIAATKEAKEANIEKAFATAIAQLASESSSVRLGCIYSLHDIAKKDKGRREKYLHHPMYASQRKNERETISTEKYKDKPSE